MEVLYKRVSAVAVSWSRLCGGIFVLFVVYLITRKMRSSIQVVNENNKITLHHHYKQTKLLDKNSTAVALHNENDGVPALDITSAVCDDNSTGYFEIVSEDKGCNLPFSDNHILYTETHVELQDAINAAEAANACMRRVDMPNVIAVTMRHGVTNDNQVWYQCFAVLGPGFDECDNNAMESCDALVAARNQLAELYTGKAVNDVLPTPNGTSSNELPQPYLYKETDYEGGYCVVWRSNCAA